MNPLHKLIRPFAKSLKTAPKAVLALVILLVSALLAAPAALAADVKHSPYQQAVLDFLGNSDWTRMAFFLILILTVIVFLLVVLLVYLIDIMIARETGVSLMAPFRKALDIRRLWAVTPSDKKAGTDVELGHDYDGITELDNAAPPLFNYILYGTIIFAVLYLGYYHVFNMGPFQEEELQIELAEAEAELIAYQKANANMVTAETVKEMKDPETIAAGKKIFEENCKACHGPQGQGLSGPNLTDKYWLHGGTISQVFTTVSEGVPAKGMIAWKANLKPGEIAQVVNFILSIQGTNPPNAKEPEGKLDDGAAAAPADSSAKISMAGK